MKRQRTVFAVLLMFLFAVLTTGCGSSGGGGGHHSKSGGGGGGGDGGGGGGDNGGGDNGGGGGVPAEMGSVTIHWPYGGNEAALTRGLSVSDDVGGINRPMLLSPATEALVGSIRVSVFQSDGLTVVAGAQGEVTGVNPTATILVPIGTGYEVCALAVAALPYLGGPNILGSGCTAGVDVSGSNTSVTITLRDAVSDVTASTPAGPNFAFLDTPMVTFAQSSLTGIGGQVGSGPLPANIAPVGVHIYAVDDPYTGLNFFALCDISAGDSCEAGTVPPGGLGAVFAPYTSALNFRFLAEIDTTDYAMPSTLFGQLGAATLWPVGSAEPASIIVKVRSSAAYAVNPSAMGGIDVNFN